jgi:hypothetical protein
MFMSVFSFVVVAAGDSFITVVLLSFFSAGGLVTVVSFCSQATNNARPASRQMYFFIQTESYFSAKLGRLSQPLSFSSPLEGRQDGSLRDVSHPDNTIANSVFHGVSSICRTKGFASESLYAWMLFHRAGHLILVARAKPLSQ